MSKRTANMTGKQTEPRAADPQRTTMVVGVATFLGLSLMTLVAWAVMRKTAPAPAIATPTVATEAVAAPEVERISIDEFKAAFDRGEVAVLDVRTVDDFMIAHIPGAMQIPLSRVEGEIPYLPRDKRIVAYCTCPNDESSIEAAQILRHGGIDAVVLRGGLEAWTNAGYATAAGVK